MAAYLQGMGGVMLGSVLLTSFLPLYVKEQIGLPAGTVVQLDTVVMVGGALSSIVWGWAADRLGSRPVILSSLGLGLLLPIGWLLLPGQVANTVFWCGVLYFGYGVVSNGSAIGTGRLLFNRVIPQEKSTAYSAIYYAWMGLTGGIAPLMAGFILSAGAGWHWTLGVWRVDSNHILFMLSFVLLAFGLWRYSLVQPDAGYQARKPFRPIPAETEGE
jgi:MFS family permease